MARSASSWNLFPGPAPASEIGDCALVPRGFTLKLKAEGAADDSMLDKAIEYMAALWEIPPLPLKFGDYSSFLEIAFAVNLLFGFWHALSKGLTDWQTATANDWEIRFKANDVDAGRGILQRIQRRHEICRHWCSKAQKIGRSVSIVIAILIARALYFYPEGATLDHYSVVLIGLSILPVPIVGLVMCAFTVGFSVWNWISFNDMAKDPEAISSISKTQKAIAEESLREEEQPSQEAQLPHEEPPPQEDGPHRK